MEGRYSKLTSSDKGSFSVKISFFLLDSESNDLVTTFPIRIDDYVDVAQTLGVTAGLGKQDVVNDKSLFNNNQKCCTDNYHVKKNFLFFRKRNTSNIFLNNNISGGYNINEGYARNSILNMFGD